MLIDVLKDLWNVAKSRAGFLALLICFVPIGSGAASNLWAAVADDWHATAGTVALQLEVNCTGAATDWVAVPSSGKSLTVGADGAAVEQPACEYRTNVTACTACAVTAIYDVGSEIQ